VAGFKLAKRETAEPAELPVRGKLDLEQQTDSAGLTDAVGDIAKRVAVAGNREFEGRLSAIMKLSSEGGAAIT
jgi:hypothetical protein